MKLAQILETAQHLSISLRDNNITVAHGGRRTPIFSVTRLDDNSFGFRASAVWDQRPFTVKASNEEEAFRKVKSRIESDVTQALSLATSNGQRLMRKLHG